MRFKLTSIACTSILVTSVLAALPTSKLLAESTAASAGQEVKTSVYDFTDKDTAIISFGAGASMLTESERKNLEAVLNGVRRGTDVAMK